MHEQLLINELIKLLCKAGGESFVGNFQKNGDQRQIKGDLKQLKKEAWSDEEIREATHYIQYINEFFGPDEAKAFIVTLISKYNIDLQELPVKPGLAQKFMQS